MPYTPCMPCIPQPMPCRLPVTIRMIQTMSAMKKIRQSRPINRPPKPKPIIPRPPPYLPNSIIDIISPFRGASLRPCTFYFLYASYRGFVHSIVKVERLTTVVWPTGLLRRSLLVLAILSQDPADVGDLLDRYQRGTVLDICEQACSGHDGDMGSTRLGGRSTSTGNNRADVLVASRVFQDARAEEGRPHHLQHGVRFVTICDDGTAPVPGLNGIETRGADKKVVQLRCFRVAVFEWNVLVGAEVQVIDQDEVVRKGTERPDDRTFCDGIGQDSRVGEGFDALDDAAGAFDTPRDLGVACLLYTSPSPRD